MPHIKKVYTEQAGDLVLFEDQADKWAELPGLTLQQREGLADLNTNLGDLRLLNKQVLDLVEDLSKATIDRVMAASDVELGLAVLLGERGGRP
ncbi:hypothetical protein [Streptomyces sp. A5-4]|uniref:hypothetical protein n=1 Tax=Streptomyces sp. A5-4 TaxID=3384771 RepID=UPI003DA97D49